MNAKINLSVRVFVRLFRYLPLFAAVLFLPVLTLDYWQAWVVLTLFFGCAALITLYLIKKDPQLLRSRMSGGPIAEKQKTQKIIMLLLSISFGLLIIVSSLDHRFSWSSLPLELIIAGDVLITLGFLIIFLVFRENTFTHATIQVSENQKVISTGPYAIVRHPMYIGIIILLLGIPLGLGSGWGALAILPCTLGIIWRLLDEEKFLSKNLPGYTEYQKNIKHRLFPFL